MWLLEVDYGSLSVLSTVDCRGGGLLLVEREKLNHNQRWMAGRKKDQITYIWKVCIES